MGVLEPTGVSGGPGGGRGTAWLGAGGEGPAGVGARLGDAGHLPERMCWQIVTYSRRIKSGIALRTAGGWDFHYGRRVYKRGKGDN